MLRRFGAFNCKNLLPRFMFNSFRLFLLLPVVAGCGPVTDATLERLAAYQRLHTSTTTSPVPPSHRYCGNMNKEAPGPGDCAGKATNQDGRIPSYEKTEMRGWIVAGPVWVEPDEMALNLLLDWGWPAEVGIRAINTPEMILETVTPFNVLHFGVDPNNRNGGGRSLLSTQTPGEAWGGPNAAVIHVENQAWRFSDSPPPSGWTVSKTNPSGPRTSMFSVDLFRPDAYPALAADVGIGTYVRVVGTQWEDDCHCQNSLRPIEPPPPLTPADSLALSAFDRWIDGTFGHGVIFWTPPEPDYPRSWPLQGRGWTEIHPVDYIATFDAPTHPTDTLEIIAMAGAGEVTRSIKLPPVASATAHVVYRVIDSPFMSLLPGDLAADEVTVTADGIDVHIKLNARPGVAPGYPKLFRGYYVAWQE